MNIFDEEEMLSIGFMWIHKYLHYDRQAVSISITVIIFIGAFTGIENSVPYKWVMLKWMSCATRFTSLWYT